MIDRRHRILPDQVFGRHVRAELRKRRPDQCGEVSFRRLVALACGLLQQRAARQELVSFPVVPGAGMGGAQRPGNGAMPHPVQTPQPSMTPPAPARAPTPAPQRVWFCTLANGESIRVDKDTMTVGRSRTCDIVIPSAKVSRQHASLSLTGIDLFIEDLGSANGVWLNGEKITRTRVSEGDVYTISDETLSFSMR